jgi:hypothetical protein
MVQVWDHTLTEHQPFDYMALYVCLPKTTVIRDKIMFSTTEEKLKEKMRET